MGQLIRKEVKSAFDLLPRKDGSNSTMKKTDCCLIRSIDPKVLSVIQTFANGATYLLDNLETSIIFNAPFTFGFLEALSVFLTLPRFCYSSFNYV